MTTDPQRRSGTTPSELKPVRAWSHAWVAPSGEPFTVRLVLDERRVQHFRNLNRMIGEPVNWPGSYFADYTAFWTCMGGREEVSDLVRQLATAYQQSYGQRPDPNRHYADFIKRFAASFPYKHDDRSIGHMEYARFPIELIYDKEGDCECLSCFLASLFSHAGFHVAVLIGYTKPHHKGGHAAVGLAVKPELGDDVVNRGGTAYLYCEAVSASPVGKCDFDFQVFLADAEVRPIPADYRWKNRPQGWPCPHGCGTVQPWLNKCPSCEADSAFREIQNGYARAADWDSALQGYLDYMQWLRDASGPELMREVQKIATSDIWHAFPSGNKKYLEKTLAAWSSGAPVRTAAYLEGARRQLLSAWPHIVAAVFCRTPATAKRSMRVQGPMSWIGMSVYDMDNQNLARFARRVLSDTTCQRIQGFSSGSHLAIGRILSSYEQKGDAYMNEKRKSIENILVKVVIPQVFTLLARECHPPKESPS
jgi:hypothetical protein